MFVTVLLVAGSLALEREENAFARLTRGLVGRAALLGEKVLLGVVAVARGHPADARRAGALRRPRLGPLPLWSWRRSSPAAPAFAAFGAAIGAAAREVRASSLLAFMISLPIAFLSLVPSGTVEPRPLRRDRGRPRAVPVRPGPRRDLRRRSTPPGPALGVPILHLAILTVAYGVLARLALRRFA